MISKEPLSVILLASKLGYQTRSFAEAARRLGVGVIVGSDRCHQLENPWADGAVPLHFEEPRNAAARLVEAVQWPLNGFNKTRCGIAGLLKMKRDCSIGPGIFELMAAIAADDDADAETPRRFRKAAR